MNIISNLIELDLDLKLHENLSMKSTLVICDAICENLPHGEKLTF